MCHGRGPEARGAAGPLTMVASAAATATSLLIHLSPALDGPWSPGELQGFSRVTLFPCYVRAMELKRRRVVARGGLLSGQQLAALGISAVVFLVGCRGERALLQTGGP